MLAEMIEKIVSLKQTQVFNIDGQNYSDRTITRIQPHVDRPDTIEVSSLDSLCKLIRTEIDKVGTTIMVRPNSYHTVEVMTTYLHDYSRNMLYRAKADVPGFNSGWRDHEQAIIQLRSLFVPGDGVNYLLDLLSRISDESSVTTKDNGVTQNVEARQGIALSAMVQVKPRVSLQPFRTFLEVSQPESEFLLRIDKTRGIGFFEADGGVWKMEAKSNIAKYFETQLADLIEAGRVVVME